MLQFFPGLFASLAAIMLGFSAPVVAPTPAPPLPHLAPLPAPGGCDNCSKLQPTLPPKPASDTVTLDFVVTAGASGAFAYCDRGSLAYTPCSEAYYAPGQSIRVNVIPHQLGDGNWYWVTALTFQLPQYGSSVTYAAYIPQSQAR